MHAYKIKAVYFLPLLKKKTIDNTQIKKDIELSNDLSCLVQSFHYYYSCHKFLQTSVVKR